jgi:hypothetical protein
MRGAIGAKHLRAPTTQTGRFTPWGARFCCWSLAGWLKHLRLATCEIADIALSDGMPLAEVGDDAWDHIELPRSHFSNQIWRGMNS